MIEHPFDSNQILPTKMCFMNKESLPPSTLAHWVRFLLIYRKKNVCDLYLFYFMEEEIYT